MQDFSVFYSWQSDAPAESNRRLIRDALLAAVTDPYWVNDALRFESGMEGTAGTPEVATIMFDKIRACSIFVVDVTLVGRITTVENGKKVVKKVPNPNVSVEMGYAAAAVGWDRIICVMNEATCFGTRLEQPFDVRNRRFPIDYKLDPKDAKDKKARAAALRDLTGWMKKALVTVEQNELRKVEDTRQRLDIKCLELLGILGPKYDSFPEPTPKTIQQCPELQLMGRDRFNAAVVRLLELGIIFTNFSQNRKDYAYHWTYLGSKLLVDLGLRTAKPREVAKI